MKNRTIHILLIAVAVMMTAMTACKSTKKVTQTPETPPPPPEVNHLTVKDIRNADFSTLSMNFGTEIDAFVFRAANGDLLIPSWNLNRAQENSMVVLVGVTGSASVIDEHLQNYRAGACENDHRLRLRFGEGEKSGLPRHLRTVPERIRHSYQLRHNAGATHWQRHCGLPADQRRIRFGKQHHIHHICRA